jgi:hypothetical protein
MNQYYPLIIPLQQSQVRLLKHKNSLKKNRNLVFGNSLVIRQLRRDRIIVIVYIVLPIQLDRRTVEIMQGIWQNIYSDVTRLLSTSH